MRRAAMMIAVAVVAGSIATVASAQTSPTGPGYSKRFFTTALENDPSREAKLQMQLHLPNRPGNRFHTHNGDHGEAGIEGASSYTASAQTPLSPKTGHLLDS